jgi:hypothetical protein
MSVSWECCVLSGRGLCDGLITRPRESYRVWCVCDGEALTKRRPWPTSAVQPLKKYTLNLTSTVRCTIYCTNTTYLYIDLTVVNPCRKNAGRVSEVINNCVVFRWFVIIYNLRADIYIYIYIHFVCRLQVVPWTEFHNLGEKKWS